MTTHADGLGDSVSVAKIGLYAAIVTAVGAIGVAVVNFFNAPEETVATRAASTVTPTSLSQKSDQGSYDKVVYNDTGTVTVLGHAGNDVDGVFVLVGPKPSGGYWVGFSNVFDQQWQADVATEPQIQQENIPITTYFHRSGADPVKPAGFTLTSHSTETTPPPPSPTNQIVECAQRSGPDCFKGPGWGPPSVYRPDK